MKVYKAVATLPKKENYIFNGQHKPYSNKPITEKHPIIRNTIKRNRSFRQDFHLLRKWGEGYQAQFWQQSFKHTVHSSVQTMET